MPRAATSRPTRTERRTGPATTGVTDPFWPTVRVPGTTLPPAVRSTSTRPGRSSTTRVPKVVVTAVTAEPTKPSTTRPRVVGSTTTATAAATRTATTGVGVGVPPTARGPGTTQGRTATTSGTRRERRSTSGVAVATMVAVSSRVSTTRPLVVGTTSGTTGRCRRTVMTAVGARRVPTVRATDSTQWAASTSGTRRERSSMSGVTTAAGVTTVFMTRRPAVGYTRTVRSGATRATAATGAASRASTTRKRGAGSTHGMAARSGTATTDRAARETTTVPRASTTPTPAAIHNGSRMAVRAAGARTGRTGTSTARETPRSRPTTRRQVAIRRRALTVLARRVASPTTR